MPRPRKIEDDKLRELLGKGASQAQIALECGVDVATVSRAIAKLKKAETGTSLAQFAGAKAKAKKPTVDTGIDEENAYDPGVLEANIQSLFEIKPAAEQNFRLLQELLYDKRKWYPSVKERIRIHGEIRAHLEFGVKIAQTLYEAEEVKAFQEEVLAVLDEFEQGARAKVIQRLKERRSLRGAFNAG